MAFNIEEFRKKRKFKYWLGSALFWGGIIIAPIDAFFSFPTPARGIYVYEWWIPIIVFGGIFYCLSRRLPLEEAIGVAKEHGNELTVTDLVGEMSITLNTAEATLRKLQRKGYAKPQKRGKEIVWIFTESKNASRAGKDKEVNPETGMTEAELEKFLESCELALAEMKELSRQIDEKSVFKQSIENFCDIIRKHIDNFREEPSDVDNFSAFPEHIRRMASLVKNYIRLSKHDERDSVHETLGQIEDTVEKSSSSLDLMLGKLLVNDLENARAEARTIERLLDLDRRIR